LPVFLWKYLSPRTGVLTDLKVRFTEAVAFNDPFEVVPYIAELLPEHAEDGYFAQFDEGLPQIYDESLRKALAEHGLTLEDVDSFLATVGGSASAKQLLTPSNLAEEAKQYLKLLSRGAVRAASPTFGRSFQEKFGERFGVLSLSTNPTSLLMWAHYADCHRGFVVGFRSEHPFLNRNDTAGAIGRVFPITYTENRPAITAYDPTISIEKHADRLIREILLTKSVEWEYEAEHRVILPLDDQTLYPHEITQDNCHLFAFPPDAVAAVIFGARVTEETRAAIRKALSVSSDLRTVPLFQAKTSDTQFALIVEAE
jgi:Protein of unknown function (DUF2971)